MRKHTIITLKDRRTGKEFQACENCETHRDLLSTTSCFMWQPGDDEE